MNATIKSALAGVLILAIMGCATHYYKPVCRHTAVLAALTVGEKYPVRLMWGYTELGFDKNGSLYNAHVQAQAFIDGQWVWLQVIGGTVQTGPMDNFKPDNELTVREFIDFAWGNRVK